MSTPTAMATLDELSVAEMDAQIAHYESMTLSLKMHRNQRSAIAKLPQEILLFIFGKAIEDAGHQSNSSIAILRRITHVCKVWRHIAIHSPVLWARIPIYRRNHEWTQLALSRSKNVLLDVSLNHVTHWRLVIDAQKMVLKELPRIAKLSVVGTSYDLERARRAMASVTGSASQLTALYMKRIEMYAEARLQWNGDVDDAVLANSYEIPLDFLADAPQLRTISLENINCDFDAPLFSNLTTLSIKTPSRSSLLSWIPFQNALCRMPLLTSLTLEHVVPAVSISKGDPVPLNHLQSLSLRMTTPAQVQAALSVITLPPIKSLRLEWLDIADDTAIAMQSSLFVRAAELIQRKDSGASFTKLEFIARRSSTELHFRASAPEIDAGPFLELIYPAKPKTLDNLSDVTKLVTKTFPLSSITHLAFETFWDDHHIADDRTFLYADLLEALPHIQTLSMRGSNAHNFLDILWFIYRDRKLVSGSILKELRNITWKRVDLRHCKSWVTECFLWDLYDREIEGGIPPLQELILEDAKNVTPDMLECLQEDIPSVILRTTGKYPDLELIDSDWEKVYDSEDWDLDE